MTKLKSQSFNEFSRSIDESEGSALPGVKFGDKEIDVSSLKVEGVDPKDHPDYADAFFAYGEFTDGTQLTDEELDKLGEEQGELLNTMASQSRI